MTNSKVLPLYQPVSTSSFVPFKRNQQVSLRADHSVRGRATKCEFVRSDGSGVWMVTVKWSHGTHSTLPLVKVQDLRGILKAEKMTTAQKLDLALSQHNWQWRNPRVASYQSYGAGEKAWRAIRELAKSVSPRTYERLVRKHAPAGFVARYPNA